MRQFEWFSYIVLSGLRSFSIFPNNRGNFRLPWETRKVKNISTVDRKSFLKKQQRRAIKSRLLFAISSMETRAPREAAAIKTDKCWLGPFP